MSRLSSPSKRERCRSNWGVNRSLRSNYLLFRNREINILTLRENRDIKNYFWFKRTKKQFFPTSTPFSFNNENFTWTKSTKNYLKQNGTRSVLSKSSFCFAKENNTFLKNKFEWINRNCYFCKEIVTIQIQCVLNNRISSINKKIKSVRMSNQNKERNKKSIPEDLEKSKEEFQPKLIKTNKPNCTKWSNRSFQDK